MKKQKNEEIKRMDVVDPKQETIKRNKKITEDRKRASDLRKKEKCGELVG